VEPFAARYGRGLSLAYAALSEVEDRAGRREQALGLRRKQRPLAEQCSAREPQSVMVREALEECREAILRFEKGPLRRRVKSEKGQ
jgi:hypothetical protein